MMKKVIITGAGGFIGKSLVKKLSLNHLVYAILFNEKELKAINGLVNVIPVIGDLNNWKDICEKIDTNNGVDIIFHLAWGGISSAAYKDINVQKDNISMSINAAMLAKAVGCRKFIFAGTNQEYLVSQCRIDGSLSAASVYGVCKKSARQLCHVLLRDEMEFCATAFTNVFGPGDLSKRTANLFIGKLLCGEPLDLIEGDNAYDWTYIDDAVNGMIAVGERGINGKQYYIGSRVLPTFKEIIQNVRDTVCPEAALNFGKFNDDSYTDYTKFDLDALYRDTGFECTADFREGILKTAEWVKNYL